MGKESNDSGLPPISAADQWSFLGGKWREGEEGELVPPDRGSGPFLAVPHNRAYADLHAEFRFRFRWPHYGGVRFVFRLQDATHYYALDIPWVPQQNRCRHMWAGIVVADGTPLQRYLNLQLIPGIAPQYNHWYHARVECCGPRIRAWIDGRPVADLEDHTYEAGRIGLMAIVAAGKDANVGAFEVLQLDAAPSGAGKTDFIDVHVSGTRVGPSTWAGLTAPEPHWITPCPQVDPETYQSFPDLIRSKSGELTAGILFKHPCGEEPRRTVWVRSRDGGRTWSDPEPATLQRGLGYSAFVRQDGTWVSVQVKRQGPPQEAFYAYESPDEGRTWVGPKPLDVRGEWPPEFSLPVHVVGQSLRLRDGAVLIPVCCQMEIYESPETTAVLNARFPTNFVLRSTDDGETWAPPVWCDRNNAPEQGWFAVGHFGENGMAEADDNVVVGYGRPGPWPYMWRFQSNDGGRTWEPASFGSFPGYCISLTGTASGALVAVHRFPYLTANVSYDGGDSWDAGTIIDYAIWSNHKALEAEPDVVLVAYMGMYEEPGQADIRMARLRVTDRGLVLDN